MKSYDPPPSETETAALGPDAAQAQLDKLHVDALADKEHPAFAPAHPQGARFRDHYRRLTEIVARDKAAKADAQKAAEDFEIRAGRGPFQQADQKAAEEEVARLKELGYEGEVPELVQPHQLTALKMQRLNAEGNSDELVRMMDVELRALKAGPEIIGLLRTYAGTRNLDPELREEIFDKLIRWIHKGNQQRHAKTRTTKETGHGLRDDAQAGSGTDDQAAGGSGGETVKGYGRYSKTRGR